MYCFTLVEGVVSQGSKKQQSIVIFSTKFEYMVLVKSTTEAIWLGKLLAKLGFEQKDPTTIYSCSQSAIAFSENPKHHSQSMHVNIKYHFTQEKILEKKIKSSIILFNYDNKYFNKNLTSKKIKICIKELGMCILPKIISKSLML